MNVEVLDQQSQAVVLQSDASSRAGKALSIAQQMVVDAETFSSASQFLVHVKREAKEIEAAKQTVLRPLLEATAALRAGFRPAEDALADAERVVKGKLTAWQTEQERKRQEDERKAREEQRREEERLAKLAAKAAARGDEAKAEEFAARAESVALAQPAPAAAPTAEGLTFALTYSAEITDLKALCAAVLAGTVPELAVCADMKYLNATARATKGAMKWPGVTWVMTKVARQRT